MTEAELVSEIEGENLPTKPSENDFAEKVNKYFYANGEAVDVARKMLATASAMLADPNPGNLRSHIMTRLSAVMTLVGGL